jgi:hypothetical protein
MKGLSFAYYQWDILFFVLCGASVILLTLSSFIKPLGLYDEGFSLTNALRILNGDIPHRDYWAAYPPGTSFTLAVAFSLFEPSLIVARFVNLGWTLILLFSMFFCLKRFAPIQIRLSVVTLACLWVSAAIYPSYSVLPALALTFLALAFLVGGIKAEGSACSIIGGCLAGSITLFRHDISGYLFVSLVFSLLVCAVIRPLSRGEPEFKKAALFILSFLVTAILLLSIMLIKVGGENFFQQAILFPATGMREYRHLPVPGFFNFFQSWKTQWLLAWIVPIGVFIGYVHIFISRQKNSLFTQMVICMFALMAILLTMQAHNRFDLPHAAPSMLFLLCFFIAAIDAKPQKASIIRNSIGITFIMAFSLFSMSITIKGIDWSSVSRCVAHPKNIFCIPVDSNQIEVVDFINHNATQDDYVFVGNTYHDRIYINDASLYFLLRKPIPIKWNEMHPGIVTTKPVQEEIVHALNTKQVRFVVLVDMPEPREENLSSISSNVHLLDNFIKDNYSSVFSSTKYSILKRTSSFIVSTEVDPGNGNSGINALHNGMHPD